jgi:UDP-N-acetylmuramate--alanine ligase
MAGFAGELRMRIPGRHNALNAAAALALTDALVRAEEHDGAPGWNDDRLERVRWALEDFKGSKRRAEILGETEGVLFMDDYGHHPTAIRATLEAVKDFYPNRRLVVSFMSHTYTRTAALLDAFAASFKEAHVVLLHKIYPSARESYNGGVTGKALFEKTRSLRDNVYYVEEPLEAQQLLKNLLRPGDLFLTMGAGDNWKLAKALMNQDARKICW